jgi:hypothetical protein
VSKGRVREVFPLIRVREGDAGGDTIDVGRCRARTVLLRSSQTPSELRAIGATYLYIDDGSVVLRRTSHVVAKVITEVAELRRCIEQGTRFEADLAHLIVRGGLAVRVRPVARR